MYLQNKIRLFNFKKNNISERISNIPKIKSLDDLS